jgi:Spy/CpxP family protein refolding chaperone
MNFSNPEWSLDMTHMNLRKTITAAVLIGASVVTANVMADPPQGPYYQGYGMGPGMMGGYGAGPGAAAGYRFGADLNLTAEQRSQITKIQDDLLRKRWELMGKMQAEQLQMNELYTSENRDDAAISKSYGKILGLRQEMFDLLLSAQKQVDAVLTKEQLDILKGR